MKQLHWLLLAAGISLSGAAQAHEYGHYGHGYGHGGVGFYFGVPGPYYPYYSYPYPYYPYPPAVIAPAQPPVYVEQQPQVVQQAPVQPQAAPAAYPTLRLPLSLAARVGEAGGSRSLLAGIGSRASFTAKLASRPLNRQASSCY